MTPIRVLHGDPSPEELAAVLAVVSARAAAGSAAREEQDGTARVWADRAAAMRPVPRPGPTAWRTSLWNR
ncbi:acyl-CoA carboxylase subunit epsilon [Streptacidiphilus monticola]|jgi:hypothetical protein|uniref:Acyl-CoA carboxylase subunit epsilon n=1 Tax=Streptacidiphilus monticola TaxID=2161674 RepID=A0ABW1G3W4_9ACTN